MLANVAKNAASASERIYDEVSEGFFGSGSACTLAALRASLAAWQLTRVCLDSPGSSDALRDALDGEKMRGVLSANTCDWRLPLYRYIKDHQGHDSNLGNSQQELLRRFVAYQALYRRTIDVPGLWIDRVLPMMFQCAEGRRAGRRGRQSGRVCVCGNTPAVACSNGMCRSCCRFGVGPRRACGRHGTALRRYTPY